VIDRVNRGTAPVFFWSHGDVSVLSANDTPLRAICFIENVNENTLTPLNDCREITGRLLACVIKPLVTADWWNKTLDLIEQMAREVPCYVARFNKSGEIIRDLKGFNTANNGRIGRLMN
jgi:hypothetical protein